MSNPILPTYKMRSWPDYNRALKQRGSLTIWFDPQIVWKAAPSGKCGRQQVYSDAVIQTASPRPADAIGGVRCGPALDDMDCNEPAEDAESRLARSRFQYSEPSSAISGSQHLASQILWFIAPADPLSTLLRIACWAADSTGMKAEGDGEWHARKHGSSKRRPLYGANSANSTSGSTKNAGNLRR